MQNPWIRDNPTPLAFIELGHYLLMLKIVHNMPDEPTLDFLISREKFRLHLLSYPEQRFRNCFDLLDRYQVRLSAVLRTFPAARPSIEAELSFWLRSPRPEPATLPQACDAQVNKQGKAQKKSDVEVKKPEAPAQKSEPPNQKPQPPVPVQKAQLRHAEDGVQSVKPKLQPPETALPSVGHTTQRRAPIMPHEKVSLQQQETPRLPAKPTMFGLKLGAPPQPSASPSQQLGALPPGVKTPVQQDKTPVQPHIDPVEQLQAHVRQYKAPVEQSRSPAQPSKALARQVKSPARQNRVPAEHIKVPVQQTRVEPKVSSASLQPKVSRALQRRLVEIGCFNYLLSEDETAVRSFLQNHRHFRLWLSIHMPDQRRQGVAFLLDNPTAEPSVPPNPAFWMLFQKEIEEAFFPYLVHRITRLQKKLVGKGLVWTNV